MKKILLLFTIVFSALIVRQARCDTIEDTFKKSINIQEGDLVSVFNINGDINIES